MPGRAERRNPRSFARAAPWLVSLGAHALVIIAGLFVGWIVVTADREPLPTASVSFLDPAPAPPSPFASDPAPPSTEADAPTPVSPDEVALEPTPLPPPDQLLAPLNDRPIELPTIAAPPRRASAPAPLPEVSIYGAGASNARRLVYIVDGSGSMVSTLPLVVDELKRSIDRLAPTQEFQVYFFRAGDYEAFEPTGEDPEVPRSSLHPATHANKRAAFAWLDAYRPRGTSDPLYAIEVALSHPDLDAIFLLSTRITGVGSFEARREHFLASLDRLNPRRTPGGARGVAINVVQFFDADPSGLLAEIGREHGGPGGYTFIAREEIGR